MAEQGIVQELGGVITEWAQEMSDKMRASLVKHNHVDSAGGGNLYQSATVHVEVEWEFGEGSYRIHVDLPKHYYWLNKGRQPTQKSGPGKLYDSLQGISGWIARKGIDVKKITGLKDSIAANKAFAEMVARKIHKKGFPGTHWFDEVWGGDPVPENSAAFQDLRMRIIKKIGNADFLLSVIDPNKP